MSSSSDKLPHILLGAKVYLKSKSMKVLSRFLCELCPQSQAGFRAPAPLSCHNPPWQREALPCGKPTQPLALPPGQRPACQSGFSAKYLRDRGLICGCRVSFQPASAPGEVIPKVTSASPGPDRGRVLPSLHLRSTFCRHLPGRDQPVSHSCPAR